MLNGVEDDDPTGAGGPPYLQALAWWLTASGVLLLLPRQWAAAGIAFGLGGLSHVAARRRARRGRLGGADPGDPKAPADA